MPLYDYRCPACGDFRAWRPMSAAGGPADCPSCDGPAARVIGAPNLALMANDRRVAHTRNEKSAHEPEVVSRSRPPDGGQHDHAHGHGHAHRHGHGGGSRPWMIGH